MKSLFQIATIEVGPGQEIVFVQGFLPLFILSLRIFSTVTAFLFISSQVATIEVGPGLSLFRDQFLLYLLYFHHYSGSTGTEIFDEVHLQLQAFRS